MQARLMHQGVATSQGQKDLFLEALASGLTVTAACEAGGFSANCAYLLRGKDPAFADAWAKSKARGEAALVERHDLLFAPLLDVVEQVVERLLNRDAHRDLYGVSHCGQSSFRPVPGACQCR